MTPSTDILEQAVAWRNEGLSVAIATVVRTWGSAPRQPGSQMSVNERDQFVGSVSGGCVEGAVIQEAEALLERGGTKLLTFGVSDEQAWEVGLACGGTVEVFVRRVEKTEVLRSLLAAGEQGEAVVLITDLDSGDQQLVFPHRAEEEGSAHVSPELLDAVREAVQLDRAAVLEDDGRPLFLNVFNPPARIVIVGAVHIAQPLAVMAREAAFGVTVVDPREAFATEERFPGVDLRRTWPAEALEALGIDHRTAIVTVTHDPKLDDPALQTALRSPAFYVGALGSRRTHAKRVARLEEAGFGADEIARIHAPVGLPIAARTPGEIASSVLSEIIRVLRGGDA